MPNARTTDSVEFVPARILTNIFLRKFCTALRRRGVGAIAISGSMSARTNIRFKEAWNVLSENKHCHNHIRKLMSALRPDPITGFTRPLYDYCLSNCDGLWFIVDEGTTAVLPNIQDLGYDLPHLNTIAELAAERFYDLPDHDIS